MLLYPSKNAAKVGILYGVTLSIKHDKICEISSSHGGEYDVQSCLLGYTAV
jgi:hypothetical protein